MVTIRALKQRARADMRETRPSVYRAAVLFIAVSLVLSILISFLTGQREYMQNVNSFAGKYASELYSYGMMSDPEHYVDSIEKFAEAHSSELLSLYPKVSPSAYVIAALVTLMSALVSAGFDLYCLKVSRRQDTKTMDIFTSFEFLGKAVLIIILQFVFIVLWSLLLFIPGIIAAYRYSQSFFIMYEHPEYSAYQCIRESSKMMRGNKWKLFVLQLSFIGWLILDNLVASLIILPLFSIFVQPYFCITRARFYNAISAPAAQNRFKEGGGI